MGFLSGTTLGLVVVVLLHVIQTSLASKRMERKVDSLMKQAGLDLAQFDAQEAQNWQQFAPRRQLLLRLVLLGLVAGAAVTGLFFVLWPWLVPQLADEVTPGTKVTQVCRFEECPSHPVCLDSRR